MVYTRKIFRFVALAAVATMAAASQATSFAVLFANGASEQVDGCEFSTSNELFEKPQGNFRLYGPGQMHWGNAKLIWSPKSNIFDEDINNVMSGKSIRKNITINLFRSARDITQYNLLESWITSIGLPACNKNERSPGNVDLTFTTAAPIAIKQAPPDHLPKVKQKAWLCCNFRLRIDGLDETCKRVTKVDSFTIKQGIADVDGDGSPDYTISDLTFQVPRPASSPLAAWFFGGSSPRNGYLDYLDERGEIMHRLAFQVAPIAIGDLDADGFVTMKCSHVGPVKWMAPEAIR